MWQRISQRQTSWFLLIQRQTYQILQHQNGLKLVFPLIHQTIQEMKKNDQDRLSSIVEEQQAV